MQEAFLAVWTQADRLDASRGRVDSLVMTVVHRRAIDAVRAGRGQTTHGLGADFDAVDTSADVLLEAFDDARAVDKIRGSLDALPAEQRRVIEMAYFEGLTQTDIADALNAPLGTVKSRLRLGLEKVRTDLGVERPSDVR